MNPVPNIAANPPTNTSAELPQPQALTSLDFLKILVAEFQNQDPTSPTDPTQFASQMVQFANLGQLENIDTAVQKPATQDLMQAASAFIGREVVTPVSSDSYRALVFNAPGQLVDNVALGDLKAGALQTFSWEPPSAAGDGTYQVSIINSNNVALGGLLEQGVVRSVSLTGGGASLDLGNLVVSESQVTSVAQP
jgi:flagellar basal-body rod modification protein FlgD